MTCRVPYRPSGATSRPASDVPLLLARVPGQPERRGAVDRRLHRCSAASRDCISGIDGAEDVVTPQQEGFLHEAARFDTARLIIIAFCCRSSAMTQQTR